MRTLPVILIAVVTLFHAPVGAAKTRNDRIGYIYEGFAVNYSLAGPRIGRNNFEIGLYPVGFGAGMVARNSARSFYVGFGVIVNYGVGPYASVGFEKPIFSFLDLRGELIATGSYQGHTDAAALLGVCLGL